MDPLAVYAAVVATASAVMATLSLGAQVYVARRDRPSLKFEMSVGVVPKGPQPGEWGVFFDVTNKGRRPLTVEAFGFDTSDRRDMVMYMGPLPQELAEGGHYSWATTLRSIREGFAEAGERYPRVAWVQDSLGKKHRIQIPRMVMDAGLSSGSWAQVETG